MWFEITYDYANLVGGELYYYRDNVVGKDGQTPVAYGPNGPRARFDASEIVGVTSMLYRTLGVTDITLHLKPLAEERRPMSSGAAVVAAAILGEAACPRRI